MNLTLLASLISAGLAATLSWGAAWHIQDGRINTLKLEQTNDRITAQRAARQAIERHQTRVSTAQAQAAAGAVRLAADLAGNRTELERLRIASTAALRAAGSTLDACTTTLSTVSELQLVCAARLTDVAAEADGWATHAVSLQTAWPQ